jgi:predicted small integral membrane protein
VILLFLKSDARGKATAMRAFRSAQTALVGAVAFLLTLIALNNLTDYDSNFHYVAHVLSMDTTFPDNQLKWRALTHPFFHHLFYCILILWEATSASLCWLGALHLYRKLRADQGSFHHAKSVAVYGLVLSMLQWLVAFLAIGGEWFVMWQSPTSNGQDAALRMFVILGIVLLFVSPSWEKET